mgnify:CR=1 FL=1
MSGNKKLKCYFAFSNDIENNQVYVDMLSACLSSAKKNTTLDLHCLYDGEKSDKLYNILSDYNVHTHICRIPFENFIYDLYSESYMNEKFGSIISEASLRSRFLRFLVSEIEKEDEYVLYCDTDVIFLQDITLADFPKLPKYVLGAPEFKKSDFSYFNAGVMLINVKEASKKYQDFLSMIKSKKYAQCFECCDQGYLNDLYKNEWEHLPLEYNWKPYWGKNVNAKIIHFHGVKPNSLVLSSIGWLQYLPEASYDGFYYYYNSFCDYVEIDRTECLNKLTWALMCCHAAKKEKRKLTKIQKIKKILITLIPYKPLRKKLREKHHV